MNRAGLSWNDTHQPSGGNLKAFDLKVGDTVIFSSRIREDIDERKKLRRGEVVGIYPHIFHIRYYIGKDEDIPMYRSFPKTAYQIGEVVKER